MDPVVFDRYCIVWYGIAWYCIVWYGIAWYCIILYNIAFCHNETDPVVFDRNTEKPVYGVHLEQAAMIQVGIQIKMQIQLQMQIQIQRQIQMQKQTQVAGCTGRVVVHDFWQYDSYDTFGLEAYMIDKTKCDL